MSRISGWRELFLTSSTSYLWSLPTSDVIRPYLLRGPSRGAGPGCSSGADASIQCRWIQPSIGCELFCWEGRLSGAGKDLIDQTLVDDHNDKDASVSSSAPSWEEIAKLLKQVPYFTKPEPPSTNMNDFFLLTNRFFVDMPGNPSSLSCLAFHAVLQNPFFPAFSRCKSTPLLRWRKW